MSAAEAQQASRALTRLREAVAETVAQAPTLLELPIPGSGITGIMLIAAALFTVRTLIIGLWHQHRRRAAEESRAVE
jgi:hypothetical protein